MAPNPDDFETQLNLLGEDDYAYVVARSYASSDKEAYLEAGYSKSSWFRLGEEHREHLTRLAARMKRHRVEEARRLLNDTVADAVRKVINRMEDSDSDATELRAAQEVLSRVLGPISQSIDVTSGGERLNAPQIFLPAVEEDGKSEADGDV